LIQFYPIVDVSVLSCIRSARQGFYERVLDCQFKAINHEDNPKRAVILGIDVASDPDQVIPALYRK
jgi:hypothetical protein